MNKPRHTILLLNSMFSIAMIFSSLQIEAQTQNQPKPNIIFILTDDQRWDALGYVGNEIIKTPEMDKLASEGVYFSHAIVTTPICAASRASIFSGLHERTHRYNFQTGPLKEDFYQNSYPLLLRQAGYYTGFFGKFGVGYQSIDQLFDEYDDYDRNNQYKDKRGYFYKTLGNDTVHLTRFTGQQALDFIDAAPDNKPFCLSLSFSAPHAHDGAPEQYFWQETTSGLYRQMDMPPPLLGEDKYFEELPQAVRDGFNRLRWTWRYDTPEKYQHSVKGYYRMIGGIDLEITKIRNKLKEKGRDKNTVIILMGDNGYFLGERQLAGKWLMYDNSIRVPLIVYDPRNTAHKVVDKMTLNIDVPATILDLASVPRPASWQGESLMTLVNGTDDQFAESVGRDTILIEHLWEFEHIPPSEGVRTAQWKYFRYVNDQSSEELYDLKNDPLETKNLAKLHEFNLVLGKLRNKCNELANKYADPFSGRPEGMMVNLIRKPEKAQLNDLQPKFSWIVPSKAITQKAYQILVASDKQSIENNIGDLWNSGQVRDRASINIAYSGMPLHAKARYYWKVRIWDQENRLSDYSSAQQFVTGKPDGLVATSEIFETDRILPHSMRKLSGNGYFFDFGKDAFATLQLNYNAQKSHVLTIRLGEQLAGDRIERNPQGSIKYQEVKLNVSPDQQSYQISLTPNERNTKPEAVALPDSFPVLMPFRYVEIEGAKAKIAKEDVTQLAFHAYFDEDQSDFTSPDSVLNQVWELCKYTIKATSFTGIYVDGERERIPYEADAYLNQLSHYTTDREYAIARSTIAYFMQHPTWPTEWQLHVALMFYQDYLYTGNTDLISKYYEPLKHKTLMELAREDGLISSQSDKMSPEFMKKLGFSDPEAKLRDIVDWPPAQKDTGWKLATPEGERDGFVFMPISTVINALYYKNMEIMAEFAHLLGKPEEELEFRLNALKAKKSINAKLFDTHTGAYVDGEGTSHSSVHANMFALAMDVVPEIHQKSVASFIKSRGMACSVYGAQYLMEALYKAGEANYALELMTATHDRSWYNMIKSGSTMTMEAWDMKYKPNSDWNHAWGAVPANIIPRFMWGIQPKTAGYGVVQIKPQLAGLPSSSITSPTIRGLIKCNYVRRGNRLQSYRIELPGNMVGEFIIEGSGDSDISVNGQNAILQFGSIRLQPGINDIEIRINSF